VWHLVFSIDKFPIVGNEMADHARVLSLEIRCDCSARVIQLLEQTFAQYCPLPSGCEVQQLGEVVGENTRLLLYVLSQIADEYYHNKKYELAQKYYTHIERTYITEHWYSLSSAILTRLMEWYVALEAALCVYICIYGVCVCVCVCVCVHVLSVYRSVFVSVYRVGRMRVSPVPYGVCLRCMHHVFLPIYTSTCAFCYLHDERCVVCALVLHS
jgi:hypothetical protein